MTKTEVVQYIRSIDDLETILELRDVLRVQLDIAGTRQKRKLAVGDDVKFKSKKGEIFEGVITAIKKKNVDVKLADGKSWRVSPLLLEKVN